MPRRSPPVHDVFYVTTTIFWCVIASLRRKGSNMQACVLSFAVRNDRRNVRAAVMSGPTELRRQGIALELSLDTRRAHCWAQGAVMTSPQPNLHAGSTTALQSAESCVHVQHAMAVLPYLPCPTELSPPPRYLAVRAAADRRPSTPQQDRDCGSSRAVGHQSRSRLPGPPSCSRRIFFYATN